MGRCICVYSDSSAGSRRYAVRRSSSRSRRSSAATRDSSRDTLHRRHLLASPEKHPENRTDKLNQKINNWSLVKGENLNLENDDAPSARNESVCDVAVQTDDYLLLHFVQKQPEMLSETFLRLDRDNVLNNCHHPEIVPTVYQSKRLVGPRHVNGIKPEV